MAPSVEATANALGRLLPWLGESDVGVRRLYAGVVRSRLLYRAPIWTEGLMTNRRSLLAVRRLHRTVAIRVVRGSRTISAAAAAVLNGFPPSELQALRCREIYLHTRGLSGGVGPVGVDVRVRARRALLDRWRDSLDTKAGAPGISVLGAVLPNWDAWLDGGGPPLTHRVTLTGHGCFAVSAEYLHRIGKEATARCHHCDGSVDSAQHTLEYCPAWARPRRDLIVEVGWGLSSPTILGALLGILMEQGGSGIDGSVAGGVNFCSIVGDLRILLCGLSKNSKDFEGTEG
ncbi:uncharacterized protein LOC117238966 [Bombus vosnesenskii]|uniref:Uncharacterized protein LOC117238966 n=1 Tax=Bombus vosnesenskii TaxID=207650 RepID=A0A6J3L7Y1_9HYME|nr:uncharacterized protein LOC117238966 [Bombus vosnesenskii]